MGDHSVKRLALIGVVAATIGLALSVCGTSPPASAVLASSSSKTTLTVVDDELDWRSLDPATAASEGALGPAYPLIYGELFTVSSSGKAIPDLATGYSWSNNDLTFTLHLRSGLKFQDGTPLNATAVKESLERDLTPSLDCECLPALSAIKSISTPTPTEVVIDLSHPDGVLLAALETAGAGNITDPTALAKEGAHKYALSPVGAGPFRLVTNVVGSSMTFERWPGYWDAKNIHLQTIKILSQNSATTEVATVQSGAAQLLTFIVNATEEKAALADPNIRNLSGGGGTWDATFLYLNPGASVLKSKLAREALFYATDRATLSKVVYSGYSPPTEQLVASSAQGFLGNTLKGFPAYNPAKAKALVKQLGGLSVNLLPLEDNTAGVQEVEALQKMWAAVGIKTTIQEEAFDTVLQQMEKGDYQIILAAYAPQSNAAIALDDTLQCKAFFDPNYCDETVANDEKKALDTVSVPEQAKLVRDSETQAIVKDFMYIPLLQSPTEVVEAKNLKGVSIDGGDLYLANAYFGQG